MRILSFHQIIILAASYITLSHGWVLLQQQHHARLPMRQKMADRQIHDYREQLPITMKDSEERMNNRVLDVAMKFGGSSLANADRIEHVAQIIKGQLEVGYRPRAVVCSAMGKTTNSLLSAGQNALEKGVVSMDEIRNLHTETMEHFNLPDHTRQEIFELLNECESLLDGVRLIQELSPKTLDQLVSYGERCSVRIVAARLNQLGVPAQAFDSWDVGICTDSNFGDAQLRPDCEARVRQRFDRIDPNIVAVVTGFIGRDDSPTKQITTLGRGGSDLTATQIGASLGLDEIQVWKDVDGILTSDPRIVPHAIPLGQVTYDEASELAHFGAKVLHPIAMVPAMKRNVPVRVKNSYNPHAIGTTICNEKKERRLVTAITTKRNVKLLDIHSSSMVGTYGFLVKVFAAFDKHKVVEDVLASSEVSVSLTMDEKQDSQSVKYLMDDLQPIADLTLHEHRAILTLITDVERSSDVLATVFQAFSFHGIKVEMMSQGASKVNISFILPDEQVEQAILLLHKCFFEDECAIFSSEQQVEEEADNDGDYVHLDDIEKGLNNIVANNHLELVESRR